MERIGNYVEEHPDTLPKDVSRSFLYFCLLFLPLALYDYWYYYYYPCCTSNSFAKLELYVLPSKRRAFFVRRGQRKPYMGW